MLIELSSSTKNDRRFWETVNNKQPPIYSISEDELKKARVQLSIGIVEPRVKVSKIRIKLSMKVLVAKRIFIGNKDYALYKDDDGLYLKELNW